MLNKKHGVFFIVSAPSGAGKSTIIDAILKNIPTLKKTISYTTRAPRGTEQNGVDYFFITKDEFKKMIKNDEFIEWAEVYGNFYGTAFKQINEALNKGLHLIKDLDTQGALILKQKMEQKAVLVFVMPPSREVLEQRLKGRQTDSDEVIAARLKQADLEMSEAAKYHHVIVNDEVLRASLELEKIMNGYIK